MQLHLLSDGLHEDGLHFDLENVGAKNYLTHNFHPYPAKFIPQIPATILDSYGKPAAVVLDPFCGSGTVAVEATLRGYHCLASDINPIATLIAAAKTLRLSPKDKLRLRALLFDVATAAKRVPESNLPQFKNRDLWFSPIMLKELAGILKRINELPRASGASILARCAFSAIVVKCSNQESETRWRSINKDLREGFAIESYLAKLGDMLERSSQYSQATRGSAVVKTGSALCLKGVRERSIDIVITSPPYSNSHDYYLYNKLRMFWLGYDHYPLQALEVGSRHRHSDLKEPVSVYLLEMRKALSEIVRVLKPKGVAAIVVGDSIHKANLVDMGDEFIRLAEQVGLVLLYHYDFDQRRYTAAFQRGLKTTPKRTHILIFQR